MMTKLKLKLKPNELISLSKHLATTLGSIPVEDLRKEPADMLIMSALYELYANVKDKTENVRIFGSNRREDIYSVTITRTQALALFCSVADEPSVSDSLATYEGNFMQHLLSIIHQKFLV